MYVIETNLFGILLKPDTAEVYQLSLLIVAGLHVAGFLVTLLVFSIDAKRGKILSLPENSSEVLELKKKIDKGYKWFKENYLKERNEDHGRSELRGASTTNYTLNNRLQTEKKEGGRDEDGAKISVGKGTIMSASDQKEVVVQDEGEKDSLK